MTNIYSEWAGSIRNLALSLTNTLAVDNHLIKSGHYNHGTAQAHVAWSLPFMPWNFHAPTVTNFYDGNI